MRRMSFAIAGITIALSAQLVQAKGGLCPC